jgi:hypothetical protein
VSTTFDFWTGLRGAEGAWHRFTARWLDGRWWAVKTAVLAALVTLCVNCPDYPNLWGDHWGFNYWPAYLRKFADPWSDLAASYPGGSHQAKLTPRLTVPLVAHVLGLGKAGTVALFHVVGVMSFWVVAHLGARLATRAVGIAGAFLFAGLNAGSCAFTHLPMYDGIALACVLAAAMVRSPYLAAGWIFVGAWTDERALLASLAVLVVRHLVTRHANPAEVIPGIAREFGVLALAWLAYALSRVALARTLGWAQPMDATGFAVMKAQVASLPVAMWFAFEAGWALILAASVIAVPGTARLRAFMVIGIALGLAASLAVIDIGRTLVFLTPWLFAAIGFLRLGVSETILHRMVAGAAVLSLLAGNANVVGASAFWIFPLPLRIVQWL